MFNCAVFMRVSFCREPIGLSPSRQTIGLIVLKAEGLLRLVAIRARTVTLRLYAQNVLISCLPSAEIR